MAQEYQQPVDSTSEPPHTQRMTAAEARAVIDLWQQERVEQTGLTDKPAVPDVAEGLDITVEDVQRLLSEVRARRLEEERALTVEQFVMVVRLAEEERKLAETQRQRADLRREQAEAERRRHSRTLRQARAPRRVSPPRRLPQPKQDALSGTYQVAGIILFLWFACCLYYIVATALP